jgi:hypothetical protein
MCGLFIQYNFVTGLVIVAVCGLLNATQHHYYIVFVVAFY